MGFNLGFLFISIQTIFIVGLILPGFYCFFNERGLIFFFIYSLSFLFFIYIHYQFRLICSVQKILNFFFIFNYLVCTFRNKYEAFKCLMCDTRKGTSTRKPRLNPSVVQQQTLVQKMAVEVEKAQLKFEKPKFRRIKLKIFRKQRTNSETAMHNSPECFSPSTSANSPVPTRASSSSNNQQKSV